MAKRDINKARFDEKTSLKLDIFRECFRAWFPVLANDIYTQRIYIFDLFAGSGTDEDGEYGSPLILLDEAKGDKKQFCHFIHTKEKDIHFIFNEKLKDKSALLEKNITEYFNQCEKECDYEKCIYRGKYEIKNDSFINIFNDPNFEKILQNKTYGKFLLLDQYGFKEIGDDVFLKLISYPKTDFIFFIASNYIKRFKNLPAVTDYFQKIGNIDFDESQPKECHRIIANYYRSLLPSGKEYYLHHFSYLKKTNYYGLIFGTNHTYGMEKFLKVCWNYDPLSGESTENINNDFEKGSLFFDPSQSNKKQTIKELLKNEILNSNIRTNLDGFKFVLSKGGETTLYIECINELIRTKKVTIEGRFNQQKTSIHRLKDDKIYKINIINQ